VPPVFATLRLWIAPALLASAAAFASTTPLAAEPAPTFLKLRVQPAARVRIEAARFHMGSDDDALARALSTCLLSPPASGRCRADMFADEKPDHDVYLSAYAIDRLEVSNQSYLRCVSAGACAPSGISESDPRVGRPEHPVASIRWRDADAYCRWVKGALPTEAQWERAARGDSARSFPWGHVWNTHLANHGASDDAENESDGYRYAAPVDAFSDGRSFYGLQNMGGNVWEFVADRYAAYDAQANAVDPTGPISGSERTIRGGSWRSPPHMLRVTARSRMPESERRADVGFRCAYAQPSAPRPQPAQ
jgi:formylglycine-generating enzyme required for sulfatase activity